MINRIKILYVMNTPNMAGAEICLLTLIEHLNRDKFEPIVVLPSDGPLVAKMRSAGVNCYQSKMEWWIRSRTAFFRPSAIWKQVKGIVKIIDSEKPDVVHTNSAVVFQGAVAAKMRSIPHMWHLHERMINHPSFKPVLSLTTVFQMMDLLSDKVIVVSDAVRRDVSTYISPDKVVTIYNGADDNKFVKTDDHSIRDELNIAPVFSIAVTVGSLIKEKNHEALLDAASLVRNKGGKVKFIIAGAGSFYEKKKLLKGIKKRKLNDDVLYIGFRGDIPDILKGSDFMIITSLSESFSLAAVEAMASGIPVIATDCGGPSEIVVDGESGFIVPQKSPMALCERISYLVENEQKRKEMGRMARRRFETHFQAAPYARQFESLYLDLSKNVSTPIRSIDQIKLNRFMREYQLASLKRLVEAPFYKMIKIFQY